MANINETFINTSKQKILYFLAENIGMKFFDKEISEKSKISRGATNKALKELAKSDLILKETSGRMNFYQANSANPLLKQFKVLNNIIILSDLIKKLKETSEKIILFGSVSRGENYKDSDTDIFILTHDKERATEIIKKSKLKSLQPIVKTPAEFIDLEKNNLTFYQEIIRGIVLWERYE